MFFACTQMCRGPLALEASYLWPPQKINIYDIKFYLIFDILNIIKWEKSSYSPTMKPTTLDEVKLLLGSRIKQLRTERGFSQNEFATHAGLTQAYLSRLERGLANPQVNKIYQITEGLGISLSELFIFDNEPDHGKNLTAHDKLKLLSDAVQHLPLGTAESLFDILSAYTKRQGYE